MKQIPLRSYRGRVVAQAKVDDSDYDALVNYKWHLSRDGYARRQNKIAGLPTMIRMHREIMQAPNEMQVDHINRDPLDNRRENLRLATCRQNAFNRSRTRKTGERVGVYYRKNRDHWRAFYVIDGVRKERSFKTREAAIAHREYIEANHYNTPPVVGTAFGV